MLLEIKDLNVSIEEKQILNAFSLKIKKGEIHAIMGPNGTGKSTLSKVLLGDPQYTILQGDILFEGKSILNLSTDKRALLGIFLAYQNPLEIEGVTNAELLKAGLSAKKGSPVSLYELAKTVDQACEELHMKKEMIHRSVNLGFSGGEKKRNEILQMKVLEPKFLLLDEIDSGLDVDSVQIVAENVLDYYKKNPDCAILMITHYPRLLEYIKPDYVHVMNHGQIVETGDFHLALEIEKKGYKDKTSAMKETIKHE